MGTRESPRLYTRCPKPMIVRLAASILLEPRLDVVGATDLGDHRHHRFVGAAVQGAFERGDACGDGAVQVGMRGGDDPRGEGRCAEAVFGVEHHGDLERPDDLQLGHVAETHPEEVSA